MTEASNEKISPVKDAVETITGVKKPPEQLAMNEDYTLRKAADATDKSGKTVSIPAGARIRRL